MVSFAPQKRRTSLVSSSGCRPGPGSDAQTRTSPSFWTWNSPGRARAARDRVVRQADGAREVVPRVPAHDVLSRITAASARSKAFDREGRSGGVAGDPVRRVRVTGGSREEPSAVGAGRSRGGASEAPPRRAEESETRLRTAEAAARARASRYPGRGRGGGGGARGGSTLNKTGGEREADEDGAGTRGRGDAEDARARRTRDRFGGQAGGARRRAGEKPPRFGSAAWERAPSADDERVGGMNEHELAAALVIGMKTMPGAKISPADGGGGGSPSTASIRQRTHAVLLGVPANEASRGEMRRGYLPSCPARRGDAGSPRTFRARRGVGDGVEGFVVVWRETRGDGDVRALEVPRTRYRGPFLPGSLDRPYGRPWMGRGGRWGLGRRRRTKTTVPSISSPTTRTRYRARGGGVAESRIHRLAAVARAGGERRKLRWSGRGEEGGGGGGGGARGERGSVGERG